MEAARSMLHGEAVPVDMRAEAVNCAVYVLNRVPSSTIRKTPFETWYKTRPRLDHLRIFGSTAFVHIPKQDRSKLDAKSERCIFVGYSETQKAWRFWNPVSRKLRVSRDAIFHEKDEEDTDQHKCSTLDDATLVVHGALDTYDALDAPAHETVREIECENSHEEVPEAPAAEVDDQAVVPPNLEQHPIPFGRPQREKRAPAWIRSGDFVIELNDALTCVSHQDSDPTSYKVALVSSDAKQWRAAMQA